MGYFVLRTFIKINGSGPMREASKKMVAKALSLSRLAKTGSPNKKIKMVRREIDTAAFFVL
jgi:hypothetical protein